MTKQTTIVVIGSLRVKRRLEAKMIVSKALLAAQHPFLLHYSTVFTLSIQAPQPFTIIVIKFQ